MLSADQIVVWIRARDARRFQGEMARSAASVREVGAAGALSGKKMGAMGRGMAILSKGIKLGAASIALMGAEATSLGLRFDRAMELIHTQAGATQGEVKALRGQVLNLSHDATQGPVELANALYRLEGAGLRGADAMSALKSSADLAAVGNADVEDTAKTLAQTWFVGIKGAGTFHDTVAELNATVGAGDLRLQQLVDALGTGVLPAAKEAGLSLQDVTGALAVFGDETNNTAGFMAQFATALHFLYNPTAKAEKAFKKIGLSGLDMARDLRQPRGMLTALRDLRDHLDQLPGGHGGIAAERVLGNILPGGRGRVLLVLLNQLGRYEQKLNQIQATGKNFGEAVKRTNEQPLVRLQKAWSGVEADLIKFYDVLKPLVIPVLIALITVLDTVVVWLTATGRHIQAVVNFWNGLPEPVKLAAEGLGIFVAQGLALFAVVRIFLLVASALRAIRYGIMIVRGAMILLQLGSGPLMLALMGLVTVAVLIATHWGLTKKLLAAAWGGIEAAARWAFARVRWAAEHGLLGPIALVISHWNTIIGFIKSVPGKLAQAGRGMWDWIKTSFRSAINWVLRKWNALHFTIGGGKALGVHLPKATIGLTPIPLLATGGTIPFGGLAVVGDQGPEIASVDRSGARITPLAKSGSNAALGGMLRIHLNAPVIIGGREVARATADQTADWNARRGK